LPKGKITLGKPRHRWEDAQECGQQQAFVKSVAPFGFLKSREFLVYPRFEGRPCNMELAVIS
jgi:hypothetical protein